MNGSRKDGKEQNGRTRERVTWERWILGEIPFLGSWIEFLGGFPALALSDVDPALLVLWRFSKTGTARRSSSSSLSSDLPQLIPVWSVLSMIQFPSSVFLFGLPTCLLTFTRTFEMCDIVMLEQGKELYEENSSAETGESDSEIPFSSQSAPPTHCLLLSQSYCTMDTLVRGWIWSFGVRILNEFFCQYALLFQWRDGGGSEKSWWILKCPC